MRNWKTKKLLDVCKEITSGGAAPQGEAHFTNGTYSFVRVADMGELDGAKNIKDTRDHLNDTGILKLRLFPKGTVLFTKSGASLLLNQRAVLSKPMYVVSHIGCLIPNEEITSDWLYYWMKRVDFAKYAHATTLPSLKLSVLKELELPVPSIEEQERIVAKIEELFSELDNGVETLKKTKQQLAVYRQAVLKEAFDRVSSKSDTRLIKDVCDDIKVGIVIKPAQYYTNEAEGIKAFRSANVREFHINNTDWVYLSKEGHRCNLRSEIHKGDVLIVRSGYPGTSCVVTDEYNGCNAIDILIAVPNTDLVTPEYLCAFTNSPYGRKLVSEKKRGVAQAHLNVGGYSQMKIPVPDISLQYQVVEKIEADLSRCDNIDKTVDIALQQAEAMRQSILKKAFEGEL